MELYALICVFLFCLGMGSSIGIALLLSAAVSLFLSGLPMSILAERFFGAINSYTLMAIPFFVSAAVIMNSGGVTKTLLDYADAIIGHRTGGLAKVNVLASLFFSGMSGSSTADAASQGRMLIPRMLAEGYDRPFSAGVTAAASIMAAIIPPSIIMIIYASVTHVSIGALFFAGIIPGVMVFVAVFGVVHVVAVTRGYPKGARHSWAELVSLTIKALPALMAPVIVLGGIRFGIVTPTEAGVLLCVYGMVLGIFVYRKLRPTDVLGVMKESVIATATPMFIIACSALFSFALSVAGFGFLLDEFMAEHVGSKWGFIFASVTILSVVGLFLESTAALLIFVPFFAPMARNYGVDDIHYAIVVIMTLMVATVTPPVGLQSFITSDIAGISILEINVLPFIFAIFVVIAIVIAAPSVTTFLPGALM
jgi:tripartite ATP-independent transporter DctM subunit